MLNIGRDQKPYEIQVTRGSSGLLTSNILPLKPYISGFVTEMDITDWLGYERIEHFSDDQLGLTRHLAEMERTVLSNQFTYQYDFAEKMLASFFYAENKFQEFLSLTGQTVKIEYKK